MVKFRTMLDAVDGRGRLLPDAERLTRLGQFLRRKSLNELPELYNVRRGGTRFSPAFTGWAQINGRSAIGWEEKFLLDVWYIDHYSLQLDMRILSVTFWKTIRREGISADAPATMPEFMGPHDPRRQDSSGD